MKKIEELLNLDLGHKFDTPKKLNRSRKEIPTDIIESLEAGNFTAEDIQALSRKFPVYRYRTCITAHGDWPAVSITRIGGYKNVHQNQNGSVEIYYSAIDREKIKHVYNVIKAQGPANPWSYSESSTGREFYIQRAITRETLPQVSAELKPIAERLTALDIYGYVNLYTAATPWGQLFLVLSLHPLAIPEEQVSKLIQELTGLDEAGQKAALEAKEEAERQRALETEETLKRYREESERQKAEAEKKRSELIPQIEHLEKCNDIKRGILVKVSSGVSRYAGHKDPEFVYYRYDGPGAFGRVKISTARSANYNLKGLDWQEAKQRTKEELQKFQDFRLAEERKHITPRIPKVTTATQEEPKKVLLTITY